MTTACFALLSTAICASLLLMEAVNYKSLVSNKFLQLIQFQSLVNGNFATFSRFLEVAVVYAIWLFVICYTGDEITRGIIRINDIFYERSWHLYPIGLRKIFPTMLIGAQKPVYLEGFANIRCTREAFRSVR